MNQGVLALGGDSQYIEGYPFLGGRGKTLPVSALGGKVLCQRHNNALSVLDDQASALATALFDAHCRPPGPPMFLLVDGPALERWMLKVAWGMAAAGQAHDGAGGMLAVQPDSLLPYLFRGADPPPWTGLSVDTSRRALESGFSTTTLGHPGEPVAELIVQVFGVALHQPLTERLQPLTSVQQLLLRPEGLTLSWPGAPPHLFLAFAWPRGQQIGGLLPITLHDVGQLKPRLFRNPGENPLLPRIR